MPLDAPVRQGKYRTHLRSFSRFFGEPQRESKTVFQLEAAKTPTIAAQIEQYRREAELQPNSSSVLVNLGNLYFSDQQWQNAIACYQKGIKLVNLHESGIGVNLR